MLALVSRNITKGLRTNEDANGFKINGRCLDEYFILDSNVVLFLTPNYSLTLKTSEADSFLTTIYA